MAEKQPPIAILGAGPAGLMLGRILELANINFVIFEREATPFARGYQGGSLDIHVGDGQLALREAGLYDEFKRLARYDATNVIADKNGKVFAKHDGEEATENSRPEIDRKNLREILLASIPEARVRWNRKAKQISKEEDGLMRVEFENGSSELGFRLVEGADGAWSKARSLVTSVKPVYNGMTYFTSEIRPSNPFHATVESLAGPGNYMSFGRQKAIAAQRMGDESYSLLFGLPLDEDSDVKHIVKYSDAGCGLWPLYGMPKGALTWETVPGVALIGDAAHLTIPSGEGANAALYDGFKLAEQIKKFGVNHLHNAVAEFEKEMRPRALELYERAEALSKLLNSLDSPAKDWKQSMEDQGAAERER